MDLSLFTYKEAIELISGFYTGLTGYWEEDLERTPEAKRFVEMGLTKRDEEYSDLHKASEAGYELLHEYIKNISNDFIQYMKLRGLEMPYAETSKWFKEKFSLETEEDGEYIADYICRNLGNYGYKAEVYISRKKGKFYRLEKI